MVFLKELSECLSVRLIIRKRVKEFFCTVCCSAHGEEIEESEVIPYKLESK